MTEARRETAGQEGDGAARARLWFRATLAATLLFRAWLALALPVTGDEAYFFAWGRHPDWGYYDHPPMVGWWLALLFGLSDAPWAARLPAVLLPATMALAARPALRAWFGASSGQADLAGALLLLSPFISWNVMITTDTPLTLFAFASMLLFARAARTGSAATWLLAGACLGLAFLSKYIAVLLGLGYAAWAVFSPAARGRWRGIALVFAAALPFGLLNAWWNYNACWANVMFNAINRHQDAGLSLRTPLLFAATLAYLFAPFAWYAWKHVGRHSTDPRADPPAGSPDPSRRALLFAWLLPLAVLALLAPARTIGLHWLQSFTPAVVLGAALYFGRAELRGCTRFFAAFALLHVAVIAAFALTPLEHWSGNRMHSRLVFSGHTKELLGLLAPHAGRYALASDGYSPAGVLSYHAGREVPVFGTASSHARQDDIQTDWRTYDGRDIMILRKDRPPSFDYVGYFRSVEMRTVELRGATFHLVLGNGFDYAAYRAHVLAQARDRWYRVPRWLPVGRCYFCERYFPDGPCGR